MEECAVFDNKSGLHESPRKRKMSEAALSRPSRIPSRRAVSRQDRQRASSRARQPPRSSTEAFMSRQPHEWNSFQVSEDN